jgi:hypothetical protein
VRKRSNYYAHFEEEETEVIHIQRKNEGVAYRA